MKKTKKSKLILLTILSVFGNLPTMAKETNKNKSVNSNIKKMVGLVSNMPKWSKYTLGFGVPGLAAVLIGGSIYAAKNKQKKLKPQITEKAQSDSTVEQNETYKFVPIMKLINNPNLNFSPLSETYAKTLLSFFANTLDYTSFLPLDSVENALYYCKNAKWFCYRVTHTNMGPVLLYTVESDNDIGKHWIIHNTAKECFIYIKEIDDSTAQIAGGFISNKKHA